MNHKRLRRETCWLMATILMLGLAGSLHAQADANLFRDVVIDRTSLDIKDDQPVEIRYVLEGDARATVEVYDDAQRLVRTIDEGKPSFAGANSTAWDGRLDSGEPAAPGAYTIRIACRTQDGGEAVYDPVLTSGGEKIMFPAGAVKYDAAGGVVRFELMEPARVQIRVGVEEGPLLKALADWEAFDAGTHEIAWDGRDASGLVGVPALPGWQLIARAFALPDNAIIVTSDAEKVETAPGSDREVEEAAPAPAAERRSLVGASLSTRRRETIAPHAYVPADRRILPRFDVEVVGADKEKAASPVGGSVAIRVTLDEETRRRLQRQRFEIVAYVDYRLVGEQEQGYSPYTYILDTSPYPDGKHVVTINVAGMEDQLNARSLVIDVRNDNNK